MRAVVLSGPGGDLRIDEIEAPSPEPGEVLVDVAACGICGTDLHIARAAGAPGAVLGHEIAGRVAALGSGVEGWTVGTPVALRPFSGCGRCAACQQGRADHCSAFQLVGLQRAGGFAEQVVVAADQLFRLPTALSITEQALVEPLAVALHALRRVELRQGEDLVVLGGGPVGLAVTAWARTLHAGRITVCEPVAMRRDLASDLGADVVIDPSAADFRDLIGEVTGKPQVVMECTGVPGLIATGLEYAGINGRVGVVGICIAPDTVVPYVGIRKELDVRFSIYYDQQDFVDTIGRLEDRSLAVAGLVTETITLDDLPSRFTELVHEPSAGKVVVTP